MPGMLAKMTKVQDGLGKDISTWVKTLQEYGASTGVAAEKDYALGAARLGSQLLNLLAETRVLRDVELKPDERIAKLKSAIAEVDKISVGMTSVPVPGPGAPVVDKTTSTKGQPTLFGLGQAGIYGPQRLGQAASALVAAPNGIARKPFRETNAYRASVNLLNDVTKVRNEFKSDLASAEKAAAAAAANGTPQVPALGEKKTNWATLAILGVAAYFALR